MRRIAHALQLHSTNYMNCAKHEFSDEIRARIKQLLTLNNWNGPFGLATDVFVIAVAAWAACQSMWLYPPAVLIIGARQRALASLLHESCHKTLMKNRSLNDFVGRWLAGFPIFQSHRAYVRSHVLLHHSFLGDAQRDPDYINYLESGLFEVRDRLDFLLRFVFRTALLLNVGSYLKYLGAHRLKGLASERSEWIGLLAVQAILATLFTFAAGPFGYLVFWIVPFLTSFQVIGWFSEIAEHYPLMRTADSTLTITRNRFPTWVERLVIGMHGDNYHLVHHLHAGVPFWNLAAADRVLMSDPAYAAVNQNAGGIFTATTGRRSVLRSILHDIRIGANAQSAPRIGPNAVALQSVSERAFHE